MGRALNPLTDWDAYRQLVRLIKKFKPDVVHTHAAKPGTLGRLAASACKVPVIVHTFHGHVFHSYFSSVKTKLFLEIERAMARRSSAIIAISEQQRKELVEDFNIAPAHKFRVVPLGFDLDKFSNNQEQKRAAFRKAYGLAPDEVAIGIIGRLVPVKNHALFLHSLAHVLANTTQKIKAFIVGDGDQRAGLEAMATSLGIPFSTHRDLTHPHPLVFTSWRSDVDVINAGLDVVCLTSLNEGTPVSLIEAQAANKPIVSTRVGGIADIVLEGKTALLSEVTDEAGFAQQLLKLVNNPDIRRQMGRDGAGHVRERFSYQRLVADMGALYHELLEKKTKNEHVVLEEGSAAHG